jgi:hypothetical protein
VDEQPDRHAWAEGGRWRPQGDMWGRFWRFLPLDSVARARPAVRGRPRAKARQASRRRAPRAVGGGGLPRRADGKDERALPGTGCEGSIRAQSAIPAPRRLRPGSRVAAGRARPEARRAAAQHASDRRGLAPRPRRGPRGGAGRTVAGVSGRAARS